MDDKLSSVKKVTAILSSLSIEPYEYKVAEISKLTGINRTTVYRILDVLQGEGLVIQDDVTKKYKIGPTMYHMGSIYLNNCHYESKILEVLNQVAGETRESVGLAVRDKEIVISLYEIEIHQPLKMNYRPGIYYPMNKGCYGKCLMAYYDQDRVRELLYSQQFEKSCINTLTEPEEILEEYKRIREQGYVISDEETFRYAVGVGAPVFNSKGQVNYCVAVSFIKGDDYKEKIEKFKGTVLEAAKEISKYVL